MVKIIFHLDLPKLIINVSCDIEEQTKKPNVTHLI